jgi:hypothetical protein
MLPAIVDLKITQGDTLAQTFRLLENGAPVDLAGSTLEAELRNPRTETEIPLTVTVGPGAGEFTLSYTTPPTYGHYKYDVEETDPASVVRTWIKGRFEVVRDVTNAIA